MGRKIRPFQKANTRKQSKPQPNLRPRKTKLPSKDVQQIRRGQKSKPKSPKIQQKNWLKE